VRRARRLAAQVRDAAALVKAAPDELGARVEALAAEAAALRKELARERQKASGESMASLAASAREVAGVRVVAARSTAADIPALRNQSDALRDALGSGVGVLGAEIDGKAVIIAAVTEDLADGGRLAAGDVVRETAARMGGRGGGKPRLAQAGGGDPAKLDEALASVPETVARLLGRRA
jgi:alanyl-tRNA synthetase